MYLSLNRSLLAGKQVNWHDFCALAHYHGYPGVDLDLGPAMGEGVEATRDLLASRSLRAAVAGCPVNFREDEAKFQDTLRALPDAARFCAAIGCPRMVTWVLSSYDQPKTEMWTLLTRRFGAIAKVLADHGMRFGLEYLGPLHIRTAKPHMFAYTMAEFLTLAADCGPNVGILFDTWHWHHAGDTLDDIRKAGKSLIVHVHANDAPKLPPAEIRDSERLFCGEGVIPLRDVFRTLREIGYQDAVSPEVLGRGIKQMPLEEGVRLGFQTTAQALRSAGIEV
ncbi:MAG: sugar phosphate isomerase/epimerase [Bryobacterales bacterium]|jgi:sugar phosphate isomerase/epimerase|nr:sugar phosphate isomerase/epimerase [Bryobacterales bacterium]